MTTAINVRKDKVLGHSSDSREGETGIHSPASTEHPPLGSTVLGTRGMAVNKILNLHGTYFLMAQIIYKQSE